MRSSEIRSLGVVPLITGLTGLPNLLPVVQLAGEILPVVELVMALLEHTHRAAHINLLT